ncbi:MAG: hypothetical protein ABUL77_03210 [Bacteroidota bacterium]
MLLIAARVPEASAAAVPEAARLTGLAVADVRTRLAGSLPRVLVVEPDADRARDTAAALEALGFVMLVCDPRAIPVDDDRLVARALEWGPRDLTVIDAAGERQEIPAGSLVLIQQGVRTTATAEVTKKTVRHLDLTRALLTGGLLLTKKVETKSVKTTTTRDPFLVLHRGDGGLDVIIYERRVDYRFLGAELQPASAGNFARLLARLRAWAPRVPVDDRVGRPGFLSGLPVTPAVAVDCALWIVLLARLRGLGG